MSYLKLAFILFILGIVIIILSALTTGTFSIFLFIPVFYGSGVLAIVGALLIVLSLILFVIGFARGLGYEEEVEGAPPEAVSKAEKKVKAGGILLLGPIPIIFGTHKSLVIVLVVLAIILIFAMLLFFLMLH